MVGIIVILKSFSVDLRTKWENARTGWERRWRWLSSKSFRTPRRVLQGRLVMAGRQPALSGIAAAADAQGANADAQAARLAAAPAARSK